MFPTVVFGVSFTDHLFKTACLHFWPCRVFPAARTLSPGEPGPLSGCGARAARRGGSLVSGRALGHAGGPLQDEQQEA